MKARKFTILVITLLLLSSGIAVGLGGLMNQTETIAVSADTGSETGRIAGLAGVVDAHVGGAQTIYVGAPGNGQVNRPGAATALRIVRETEEGNITLVGKETGKAYSYFANLEKNNQTVYSAVTSVVNPDLANLSIELVREHWTQAQTVVVANPLWVRDYVGGTQYARVNGYPLLYTTGENTARLNRTLQDLNTSTVYVTEHVPSSVVDALNSTYTVNVLPTSNGEAFINDQTTGSNTLYLVEDLRDVALVAGAAGTSADVMVIPNASSIGNDIENYLSSNTPNVIVVGEVNEDIEDQIRNAGADSFREIGFDGTDEMMARLALWENNLVNNPLVVVSDTTVVESSDNATVRIEVRNLGFAAAKDVRLRLTRADGDYTFVRNEPSKVTDRAIYWNGSDIPANGTLVIRYRISGISGTQEIQLIPRVIHYENTAGTSFQGFSMFGVLGDVIDAVEKKIYGFVGTVSGLAAGLSPLIIVGLVAIAGGLGITVIYLGGFQLEGK